MFARARFFGVALAILFGTLGHPTFAGDVAPRYIVDAGPLEGPGEWRPDEAGVTKAETALRAFLNGGDTSHLLRRLNKSTDSYRQFIAPKLDSYTLQFVGGRQSDEKLKIIDFDGSGPKVIYISGFCTDHLLQNLDKHLCYMADGGSCYFHAVYDPSLDAITYFGVNPIR